MTAGPARRGWSRDGAAWTPAAARLPHCGVDHGGRAGRLDESARRPDHPELAVAARLVAEGHDVVSLPERGRRGPVADFLVCGIPVEVKALLTTDERTDHRPATARTVHNRLVSAADQAAVVVVATAGSGCRAADAVAGLHHFAASGRTGAVTAVRLLGEGFDLSWASPLHRDLGAQPRGAATPPAHPDAPAHGDAPAVRQAPARRAAPVDRARDRGVGLG